MKRIEVPVPRVDGEKAARTARNVRHMFASISKRYDLLNRLLSLGLDQGWRRKTAAATVDNTTRHVLDVCGGTGDLAIAYLQAMGTHGRCTLLDFCPEMLELAGHKLERYGLQDHVDICCGDATQLCFADNSFDLAAVAFGIRNVVDMDAALVEMTRVVRPLGKVVVLEFYNPQSMFLGALFRTYLTHILPRIGRCLSGSNLDAYEYLAKSVLAFDTPEKMRERLAGAGLNHLQSRAFAFGGVVAHWGVKV